MSELPGQSGNALPASDRRFGPQPDQAVLPDVAVPEGGLLLIQGGHAARDFGSANALSTGERKRHYPG
jgi:hypothetical protein